MSVTLTCMKTSLAVHCSGRLNMKHLPLLFKSASVSLRLQQHPQPSLTRWIASQQDAPCTATLASMDQKQATLRIYPATVHSFNTSKRFSSSTIDTPTATTSLPQQSPSQLQVQLYQYRICPFCNRVKTLLDFINKISDDNGTNSNEKNTYLSVQNIEVNPISKTEIKQFSKDYRKVPIATFRFTTVGAVGAAVPPTTTSEANDAVETTTSNTIFGSDEIIHHLLTEYPRIRHQLEQHWAQQQQQSSDSISSSGPLMTYDQFLNHDSARVWTTFATNELAVWLYPNMCRTYRDSYTAFQYIHDPTLPYSTFQRYMIQYVGALAMTFAAGKIKKRHNVTDERKALNDVLVKLDNELRRLNPTSLSSSYVYLSGTTVPNMGDFNVYGVLRAVQNLPIYTDMILSKRGTDEGSHGPPIEQWMSHMSQQIISK